MPIIVPIIIIALEHNNIMIMDYWKMFFIDWYIYRKNYKKAKDMLIDILVKKKIVMMHIKI